MKLERLEQLTSDGQPDGLTYHFWCPGCKQDHTYRTERPDNRRPCWSFNGDLERPTFSPSLLVRSVNAALEPTQCHLFLTDGRLQFLSDCTHDLAGQTVDLPDIPAGRLWFRPNGR